MASDDELVADAMARNIAARDPAFLRETRRLAVEILGPHALGRYDVPEDSDARDAVHESGHAILCIHLGGMFDRVMVRPRARLVLPHYPTDEARVCGALGGACAELHVFHDVVDEGCHTDLQRAERVAEDAFVTLHVAVARVTALLRRRDAELRALAGALLLAGELTFEQCRAIVLATPGTRR